VNGPGDCVDARVAWDGRGVVIDRIDRGSDVRDGTERCGSVGLAVGKVVRDDADRDEVVAIGYVRGEWDGAFRGPRAFALDGPGGVDGPERIDRDEIARAA
jgi:hypothetical protein